MADARSPHPPMRSGMIDVPHQIAALGELPLESGDAIRDFRLSYVTHGELNAARDNALLVTVSLTGNHHRLDFLIGPGKALDTKRYFVVCVDPIGNGLTTSPSNSTAQPGMRFPRFSIRDMIAAQLRLLRDEMGLAILHAVVGASMGGMQALQWGVSYGHFVASIVAMTPESQPDHRRIPCSGGSPAA